MKGRFRLFRTAESTIHRLVGLGGGYAAGGLGDDDIAVRKIGKGRQNGADSGGLGGSAHQAEGYVRPYPTAQVGQLFFLQQAAVQPVEGG